MGKSPHDSDPETTPWMFEFQNPAASVLLAKLGVKLRKAFLSDSRREADSYEDTSPTRNAEAGEKDCASENLMRLAPE
jgi:hypothetical protein